MVSFAYELAAIFEDAFDQLNVIHEILSIDKFNQNTNHFQLENINTNNVDQLFSSVFNNSNNSSPFTINLTEIFVYKKKRWNSFSVLSSLSLPPRSSSLFLRRR